MPVANPEAQDILRQADAMKEELAHYKKVAAQQDAMLKKHREQYAAETKPQLEAFIAASERLNGPMSAEVKKDYTLVFSEPAMKAQMESFVAPVRRMLELEASEKSRAEEVAQLRAELDSKKQHEQQISERLTGKRAAVARVLSADANDNTQEANVNASAAHRKSVDDVPYGMSRIREPSKVDEYFLSNYFGNGSSSEVGVNASADGGGGGSMYGTRERPQYFRTTPISQLLVDANDKEARVEDYPRAAITHNHTFTLWALHEQRRDPLQRYSLAFDAGQSVIEEKRTPNDDFRGTAL